MTHRPAAEPIGTACARFDLVVMVDWSAGSTVGPARPSPDRCWLAWGSPGAGRRPDPEYFRTRGACEARVAELVDREGRGARVFVGFDFPIGYPRVLGGIAALPEGRALLALLADLVEDRADAGNNRFEVAGELNRRIRVVTGAAAGPFWGHPAGRAYADVPFRKPSGAGVPEYRVVERRLLASGRRPQSPWKLAGAGSVGSQSILGLPAVHRLLAHAGGRGRLWAFEPIDPPGAPPDAVVTGEIWPSLGDADAFDHPIKDARQVAAMRDALLDDPGVAATLTAAPEEGQGWIVGVAPDA